MIAAYTSICLDARIASPVRGSQPSPCQWVGMGDLQIARLGAETENLSVRERARRAAGLRTRRERTRPQASFVPPALFLRAPRTPETRKRAFERLHRDIPIARLTRAHDPPRARNCTRARNFRERDGCGASCNQFRHATCSEGRSPFAVSSPPLACNSHGWTKVRPFIAGASTCQIIERFGMVSGSRSSARSCARRRRSPVRTPGSRSSFRARRQRPARRAARPGPR